MAASIVPRIVTAAQSTAPVSETMVKKLYDSLSPKQKEEICFDWDHSDDRGLLRTHVSNNWNITEEEFAVGGKFFNSDQQEMIHELFFSLYQPDWRKRIEQQLQDDAGGYGKKQTIAIFGKPGQDKFELVMTGRHLTIRCDGNTTPHVAFGGPIFYGHAAKDFNESAKHEGNVFWPQAQKANALFQMLDGKQRKQALIAKAPSESKVEFAKPGAQTSGLPISELSADQKRELKLNSGLLIEDVRGSRSELRPGDIIIAIISKGATITGHGRITRPSRHQPHSTSSASPQRARRFAAHASAARMPTCSRKPDTTARSRHDSGMRTTTAGECG